MYFEGKIFHTGSILDKYNKFECFFMEQYFEWDEAKNRKNQKKHDISFETASLIFEDPLRISIQDRHTNGEERWQTIGKVKGVLMLLVAHTIFDEDDCEIIRIIRGRLRKRKI
jgi:uncharacterized DUF497 family protein